MKIPLSWVEEFVEIPVSTEEVADLLTFAGIEVEGIETTDIGPVCVCGITPNLGHCLSIFGIARQLSALLDRPLKKRSTKNLQYRGHSAIDVTLDSPLCQSYHGMEVSGISDFVLPTLYTQRLLACDIQQVHPVVDAANYVMLELGQPLHVFDLESIGHQLVLENTVKPLVDVTLINGQKATIPEGLLVVCGNKGLGAIAGVMGTKATAVSDTTQKILIESAYFDPRAVRASAKALQIRSDSSFRFERGVDPQGGLKAIERMGEILSASSQTMLHRPYSVDRGDNVLRLITLSPDRVNQLLGISLSRSEIIQLLAKLEIACPDENREGELTVSVPSYRNDLTIDVDIIEEIAKMYRFAHIPRRKAYYASSTFTHDPMYLFEEKVRDCAALEGLQEWLTCDLIHPDLARFSMGKHCRDHALIGVLSPSSEDQSVLRPSLLGGFLKTVKCNRDRGVFDIRAFEVGHIYFKEGEEFFEKSSLGITLSGAREPYHYTSKEETVNFFVLKGHIENLFFALGVVNWKLEKSHLPMLHPREQVAIIVDDKRVGALGQLHPQQLKTIDIECRLYYAEIDLDSVLQATQPCDAIEPPPLYPGSTRDWTLVIADKKRVGEIIDTVERLQSSLLEKVFVLDLYKSEQIGEDRKSVTFRFQYRDRGRTISYEQVEREHAKIVKAVEDSILCEEVNDE